MPPFSPLLVFSVATVCALPPAYDIVFFDLPDDLEPESIPNPTEALALLPGYPEDDQRLTLAAVKVPAPVQIPDNLPFPKVFACYYPGCSHYGYHGQASSIAANRYMPDRRTQVLLFHGTADSLLGVNDPDVTPMSGNLFPLKFVKSSQLHADSLAIPSPFVHHLIFEKAGHSFEEER